MTPPLFSSPSSEIAVLQLIFFALHFSAINQL